MKHKYWICYPKRQDEPEVVSVYAQTREQARAIAAPQLGCCYIDVVALVDDNPPPDYEEPSAYGWSHYYR